MKMNSKAKRKYYRNQLKRVLTALISVTIVASTMFVVCTRVFGIGQDSTEVQTINTAMKNVIIRPSTIPDMPKDVSHQTIIQEMPTDSPIESEQEDVLPQIYEGEFELPLQGATVYVMADTNLHDESGVEKTVNAGTSLRIVMEEGENLLVTTEDGFTGLICSQYCMLNLPDIIPSIVYMDTNSTKSVMRSSGYELPEITDEQLYSVEQYNERLGRTEFNMPIMFATAKKVMAVQRAALADGYSLCVVETYRPLDTQMKICNSLKNLESSVAEVREGIIGNGWSESWFIAQGISNHQRGYAMDVTLVEVKETEICTSGDYAYINVSDYEEVQMPTMIHELSDASVALEYAVTSTSATAWKSVPLASSMNDVAIRLQNYCVGAGFTPLASEWWHFNDLDARNSSTGSLSKGDYFLQDNLSVIP